MTDVSSTTADFQTRDAARVAALRRRLDRGSHWIVLAVVLVIGVIAVVVLLRINESSLVYFGDTASHLIASRRLFDWGDEAGLERFGTVWLPVPHLLLMPFTLSLGLFSTGLAGTAVSLPCLALTAVLLYKIIGNDLAGPTYLAAAGALVYVLNPNVLYLGLIAMTESPFMLFFVGAGYAFQSWARDPEQLRSLGLSATLVVLATLSRYEGWVLPPFLLMATAVLAVRAGLPAGRRNASIVVAALSFVGIALWVGYNAYQYGDPLEFADAQFYSAAAQALTRTNRQNLVLQPANVLGVYAGLAVFMYGPILLATGLFGFVQYVRRRSRPPVHIGPLLAFLALPPLFTLLSLLVGIGELSYWFNSRFLVLAAPVLIVLSATLVRPAPERARVARRRVAAVLAACLAIDVLLVAADRVPVVLDARGGFYYFLNPSSVETGRALRAAYDGGKIVIVTGSGQEHRIMLTAGIPLGQYDEIIQSSTRKGAYSEPWAYGRWCVLGKAPDSDAVAVGEYWAAHRAELDQHYDVVYDDPYYQIMVRKES